MRWGSHESVITFDCNYVYIKIVTIVFNFCGSKSFYYNTGDALLRNVFTNILICCDIYLTYIMFDMANILNKFEYLLNKFEKIEVLGGQTLRTTCVSL